jgi:hypothetical protein
MTIWPRRGGYQVIVYAGIDPVTGRQRQIARQVRGKREAERLEARLRAESPTAATALAFLADLRSAPPVAAIESLTWLLLHVIGRDPD